MPRGRTEISPREWALLTLRQQRALSLLGGTEGIQRCPVDTPEGSGAQGLASAGTEKEMGAGPRRQKGLVELAWCWRPREWELHGKVEGGPPQAPRPCLPFLP